MDIHTYRNFDEGYVGFHTYFDCPVIILCAKMLELKKKGKLFKSAQEMFGDIRKCILVNYVHYDKDKCYKVNYLLLRFKK